MNDDVRVLNVFIVRYSEVAYDILQYFFFKLKMQEKL